MKLVWNKEEDQQALVINTEERVLIFQAIANFIATIEIGIKYSNSAAQTEQWTKDIEILKEGLKIL